MTLELSMFHTCAVAILVLLLGQFVRDRIPFLEKFCIPTPVVGGLILTIAILIGYVTNTFYIKFDFILSDFFMLAFYSSIGFTASIKLLRQGGFKVIKYLLIASVLVIFQNGIGMVVAKLLGRNPLVGLATGSIPMVGGHGTSATFAPMLEEAGLNGAITISLAAATFGLVAGSLIGGPVGRFLAEKTVSEKVTTTENVTKKKSNEKNMLDEERLFSATCQLILAMGLGTIISELLTNMGLKFPASVGGMLASAIFINISDATKGKIMVPLKEISAIGSISLSIFLAMSMMKLELWQLADLAIPMLILLGIQIIIILLFSILITYPIMGKNYEAAVMASGLCGFGLGAVPTAMANMRTLEERYGPAEEAFFIVPLVGSLFINFVNSIVVVFYINLV